MEIVAFRHKWGNILSPFGYIVKGKRTSSDNYLTEIRWRTGMHLPRIEKLRINNGMTQQQVAELLYCKRGVYWRYEKGIRELPLSYAIMLADFYNVSLDYLVGRSNKK